MFVGRVKKFRTPVVKNGSEWRVVYRVDEQAVGALRGEPTEC